MVSCPAKRRASGKQAAWPGAFEEPAVLADLTCLADFFGTAPTVPGTVRAELGPRIRQARLRRSNGRSLTRFGQELAKAIGRPQAFHNVTVSNWETGRQEPGLVVLVAIARLTRLPLRYFAGVGELEDYPSIDWLGPERGAAAEQLERLMLQLLTLPEPQRRVVIGQLELLVELVPRAWANHHGPPRP
jgi:helix-turn-helix protein